MSLPNSSRSGSPAAILGGRGEGVDMEDMSPEERERRLRQMPPVFDGNAGRVVLVVLAVLFLVVWLK